MTTLSDLRAKLRIDLSDTDSNAYRWTDDTLDRHIAHALEDLSLAIPRELTATVATTPGSREVDTTSSLTGLVTVEKVEFPVGHFPPEYIDFAYWAGVLHLHTYTVPHGSDATIYYVSRHVVDVAGSTLPAFLEDILLMGAAAYALIEISLFAIDRLNTGGDDVTEMYAAAGRARITAFNQLLQQYSRKNRVTGRRMFVPA